MGKTVLMQGNEACVEGAIAAGMRLFAGYPITPSTEIAEGCALRLPMVGGTFIQMEDEIASIAAVIGASVCGVKSMTATSGPGFSLKQENIGYACLSEVPCVIVDVQRSGPSTGLPTSPSQGDVMQARWGTHGDHPVIALSPSSVKETYELTARAFSLSEKYRTPVILLMDEMVGHLREGVEIPDSVEVACRPVPRAGETDRPPYRIDDGEYVPRMFPFGKGHHYNITGLVHDENGFPTTAPDKAEKLCTRIMEKISANADDIIRVERTMLDDADVAVFCYGGTARSAASAVAQARKTGIKAGIFRPITIWPFPEKQLAEAAKNLKKIVVAEHNCGQLLLEVERVTKGGCEIEFIGKNDGTVITPTEILDRIRGCR